MQSTLRASTLIVMIHAFVVTLHGLAHDRIPVPLSLFQSLFVGSIIVLAPIIAIILIWTRFQKAGFWLLLSSMVASLLFGIYYHFLVISPDHVSQIAFMGWGLLFHITAILLLLVEGLGCAFGVWTLTTLQQREPVL